MKQACPAQMDHSQIVPYFCGYPQSGLWKGVLPSSSGFYGLFLELVSYDLVSETYGLFLKLVPYGLFEIRPGPQNGDYWGFYYSPTVIFVFRELASSNLEVGDALMLHSAAVLLWFNYHHCSTFILLLY